MSHHADELRWCSEPDLFAVVQWLDRHLKEIQEDREDAERTGNDWLADKSRIEYMLVYRLMYEAAALLEEMENG